MVRDGQMKYHCIILFPELIMANRMDNHFSWLNGESPNALSNICTDITIPCATIVPGPLENVHMPI